ncbi:polymerase rpb1 carboxy-terminal repeat protein [Anaeramoeba flamelloides]|uniref:Polymerase rpb1 carboxy-terminal repeat protein n=1 Tax=Anaeramoeba flamelloides TaxID=1746091 RepID=A0ABQ8YDH9_9EUKA|nr:polymerase rpb1 carboxy-terminal repeat protein [Anaeramoeba flamelloides]
MSKTEIEREKPTNENKNLIGIPTMYNLDNEIPFAFSNISYLSGNDLYDLSLLEEIGTLHEQAQKSKEDPFALDSFGSEALYGDDLKSLTEYDKMELRIEQLEWAINRVQQEKKETETKINQEREQTEQKVKRLNNKAVDLKKKIRNTQEQIDEHSRQVNKKMSELYESVIVYDSKISNLKEEITVGKEKLHLAEKKLDFQIKELQSEYEKENSKSQNMVNANSDVVRKINETTVLFNNQISQSTVFVNSIVDLHSKKIKKKQAILMNGSLENMKKEYDGQIQEIKSRELDYNATSVRLNKTITMIKQRNAQKQDKTKEEKSLMKEIEELEEGLLKEKEDNVILQVKSQRSNFEDTSYESHQIKNRIEQTSKEIEQIDSESNKIQCIIDFHQKYLRALDWSNPEMVKKLTDKFSLLLTEIQEKIHRERTQVNIKINKINKKQLPNEGKSWLQFYSKQNHQILLYLEKLESMLY